MLMSKFPKPSNKGLADPASPSLAGKRIAVIVFSYFTSDPRVFREASALAGAGAEVDLFCLRKTEAELTSERINNVWVTRARVTKRRVGLLHYIKQYALFTGLAFLWLTGRILKRGLRRRYDLVHVHNMPDFLVFAALPAKLLGAKVVLDLHDPMPEVLTAKEDLKASRFLFLLNVLLKIEKLAISFADLVLTPNIAFRDLFTSRSGPEGKIQIVMNSPLEENFPLTAPLPPPPPPAPPLPKTTSGTFKLAISPSGTRGGLDIRMSSLKEILPPEIFPAPPEVKKPVPPFILMYHGTLVERHGLHNALATVAALRKTIPNLRFHFYGAETEYSKGTILPLIEKLDIGDIVQYFGEQPQTAIADAIRASTLGLIPNLRTAFTEINFPTRIFEYLALGKPVLVPQTRGITDYFSPADMLFFENEEDLPARIQWIFDHPGETYALVERGQAVYTKHLWKTEHFKFLTLIAHLLS